MDRVYSRAAGMIAWLGRADDNSDLAIAALEQVRKMEERIGTWRGRRRHDSGAKTSLSRASMRLQLWEGVERIFRGTKSQRGRFGPDAYTAVLALSRREYWERVWIIQEMVSARDILFLCGNTKARGLHTALLIMNEATSLFGTLSGDVSERLGDPITDKLTYSLVDQRPMPRFLAGSERSTQTRERGLYHLLFYLRSGMGYKATDPRDYVYALLGLAEDREALGIIPDYTQPVEDVFTDVTRRLVANGYTDSLAFALSTKATTGLPSWVPDWRSMSHVFFCTFRTAQDQPSLETAHVTFDVADKFRLPIRAAHVGTITKLAPALPGSRDWATLMARGADPFTTTLLEWLSSVENELLLSPAEEQAQYLNNPDPVVVGMTRRAQDRARLARSLCATRSPVSDTWRRDQPERYYHLLAAMFRDEAVYESPEQDEMEKHMVGTYVASILWHAKNQCRAFRLSSGHLGLASPGCEVGDEIVYFPGGSFPFVVRGGVDGERELVGIAFVDDFRFWLMKEEPARVIVLK